MSGKKNKSCQIHNCQKMDGAGWTIITRVVNETEGFMYIYIQEQSELDRKCHPHNLSGWIKRKSVWEQMWDIQLRPMLLSGSEGFNYWWHWLICMKHLLSNVTYAQELSSGDDFFFPLVHKLSVTLKYKYIAHLKYVCCINVKKKKNKTLHWRIAFNFLMGLRSLMRETHSFVY